QRGAERRAEMARQREEKRRSDVAEREAAERRRAEERQKRCQELAKSRAAATHKQQQLAAASPHRHGVDFRMTDESKPTGRQRPLSLIQASPQQPPPSPSPRRPAVFSSGRKLSASSARRSVSAAHLADSSEQQQQPQSSHPCGCSSSPRRSQTERHCWPGRSVNAPAKTAVIAELAASQSLHFMLLFRDAKCHYLGLYSYDQEGDRLLSLAGRGPPRDSTRHGGRFTEIRSTSHLSPAIDAVVLQDRFLLRPSASSARTANANS
uniref:CKK domain-containing protein n=1 Tax=Macrostomum lignano TaxID=282301 RepID=A0A1I8JN09_9PLAT